MEMENLNCLIGLIYSDNLVIFKCRNYNVNLKGKKYTVINSEESQFKIIFFSIKLPKNYAKQKSSNIKVKFP